MGLTEDFNTRQPYLRISQEDISVRESSVSAMLGLFSFALGVVYLIGGQHRFSSQALSVARSIALWWVWGLAFLLYGLVIFFTRNRIYHWAVLFFGVFLYFVFALGYSISLPSTSGSYTLPCVFFWFCLAHLDVSSRRLRTSIKRSAPLSE